MRSQGFILDISRFGKAWAIPTDEEMTNDGRITTREYKN